MKCSLKDLFWAIPRLVDGEELFVLDCQKGEELFILDCQKGKSENSHEIYIGM